MCSTAPISIHLEKQGDEFEHQSIDEKMESLKLQRQSSRDTYSPGGSLANLGIEIIAQARVDPKPNPNPNPNPSPSPHPHPHPNPNPNPNQADSQSSRRAKLEDAHYPGSATAARVIAVIEPSTLPFEPKLTKISSKPQARLLAARAAHGAAIRSKRLRAPTAPAETEPPYLQTTP